MLFEYLKIREERIWPIAVSRGSYKTLFLLNSWHLLLAERIRFEFLISDYFLEHPRSVGDPRLGAGAERRFSRQVVFVGQPPVNHQKMGSP